MAGEGRLCSHTMHVGSSYRLKGCIGLRGGGGGGVEELPSALLPGEETAALVGPWKPPLQALVTPPLELPAPALLIEGGQ